MTERNFIYKLMIRNLLQQSIIYGHRTTPHLWDAGFHCMLYVRVLAFKENDIFSDESWRSNGWLNLITNMWLSIVNRERKRERGTTKRIFGASLHSIFGDSDIELAISSNLKNAHPLWLFLAWRDTWSSSSISSVRRKRIIYHDKAVRLLVYAEYTGKRNSILCDDDSLLIVSEQRVVIHRRRYNTFGTIRIV